MQKEILIKLAEERTNPSITISLNTHRTHPDNAQDKPMLKKLCKEARERLINQYDKKSIDPLLVKLDGIADKIDPNYNLESLHLFLSGKTTEVIRSTWPVANKLVFISDRFAVRPLIKVMNRSEEFLILLLSQSGASLFEAMNDAVVGEVKDEGFPFPENPYYLTNRDRISDAGKLDNLLREYMNRVDKAVVKIHHQTGQYCVVICTEENYSHLMQVADKPEVYHGFDKINYNDTARHTIAGQAWAIIREIQKTRKLKAIADMKKAAAQGMVLTDLQEIYRAAKQGRGELLITHENFRQAVKMTGEDTFELTDNSEGKDVIDDISSMIAWEVISKKGLALFTNMDEIKEMGKMALKLRY